MVEHMSPVPPLGNTPGPIAPPARPTLEVVPAADEADDRATVAGQRALREALRLAALGYVLVPVTITRSTDGRGKKDAQFHRSWRAGGSSDAATLRDWNVQHPTASFAILCGPSGLEVVDLDAAEGGPEWWTSSGMPVSDVVVDTPGGGQHHYFRRRPGAEPEDRLVNNAGAVALGVDARTIGGLVFAPGSFVLGEEDRPYAARVAVPGVDDLEPTPRAVLALWSRARVAQPRPGVVGQVDQDRRFTLDEARAYVAVEARDPLLAAQYGVNVNDRVNRAALVLGHFVPAFWSEDEAREAVRAWLLDGPGRRNGWRELDHEDVASIDSGLRRGMAEPYAVRTPVGSNHLADATPVQQPAGCIVGPEYEVVDPGGLPASTETAGRGVTSTDAPLGMPAEMAAALGGPLGGLPEPMTPLEVALERGRIARQARRILDAEERPPLPPPASTSLALLLTEPPSAVKYRVDRLWPSGGKVLMSAPAKAGKTTMVGNLVRCLADGAAFLAQPGGPAPGEFIVAAAGFPVAGLDGRAVFVLDFEMTRDMAREWLRDQGIVRSDLVHIELMRGRAWDPRDEGQRAAWAAHLRALNVAVLVVDPIGPILAALGVAEKDSTEVGAVLWALDALAHEAGVSELFVVHHTGHEGERARGTSGFEGWPDAIWTMTRDKTTGARALSASGRDVHLVETVLELDRPTRRLALGQGSRAAARGSAHAEIIRDIVVEECSSRGDGQPGPTSNQLKTLAREAELSKATEAQDAIHAARKLGMVHTHPGPNRSLYHHPGASCEHCPDAVQEVPRSLVQE